MCHFSTDSYNMHVNISHTVLIASVNMHQINIGCVTLCILFHNNRINHTNLLMGIYILRNDITLQFSTGR